MAPGQAEESARQPEGTGEPPKGFEQASDLVRFALGEVLMLQSRECLRPLEWGLSWSWKSHAPSAQDPPDCFISPQGCFIFSLVKYIPLTYNKVYVYPTWAIGLGWSLALSSMVCVPLVMVIRLCQTEGPFLVVSMRFPRAGLRLGVGG